MKTKKKTPRSPKKTAVPQEYVVEEIKGKRFFKGETQFFVKWEGFDAESSTWEPMQNLGKCIHLLAKYENDAYLRNLERAVHEKENIKLHAAQDIEVHKYRCSTPEEPEQKESNEWNQTCVQLSDSSDDEPSAAFEPITPPLLKPLQIIRQLSSLSSSSSSASSASPSLSGSSSCESSTTISKLLPQPQLQPVPPTNKQKVRFADSEKKLPTNTDKTRANNSLEDDENCSTPERIWDEEEPSGLELGLKLERVIHSFRFRNDLFLVVRWMGREEPDVVDLQEIKKLYPKEIIQYWETIELRYDDPVNFNSNEPEGSNNKSQRRQKVQGQRH